MIHTARIRAEARAQPGDHVGMAKTQLDELLDAVDAGQRAERELRMLKAIEDVGIGRVSH